MVRSLRTLVRFLRTVVLVDVGVFVAIGLVCWLFGWRTAYQYGRGLLWVGTAAILLGLASGTGGWVGTHAQDFETQCARSVGAQSSSERMQQDRDDALRSFGFQTLMTVAGVISLAVGWLIQSIAQ